MRPREVLVFTDWDATEDLPEHEVQCPDCKADPGLWCFVTDDVHGLPPVKFIHRSRRRLVE